MSCKTLKLFSHWESFYKKGILCQNVCKVTSCIALIAALPWSNSHGQKPTVLGAEQRDCRAPKNLHLDHPTLCICVLKVFNTTIFQVLAFEGWNDGVHAIV